MITPLSYKKFKVQKDWTLFLGNTIQKVFDENGDLVELTTVKWPLIPMAICMLFSGITQYYFFGYVFVYKKVNLETAVEVSRSMDFGVVDFVAVIVWQFLTFWVYFVTPLILPHKLKAMMKFIDLTKALGKKHTSNGLISYDEVDRIGKKVQKSWFLKPILSLIAFTITTLFYAVFFVKGLRKLNIYDQTHFYTFLGLGLAAVPFGSLVYYPLSVAFIENLMTNNILFTASAIRTWKEKFLRNYQRKDEEFGKISSLSCV